MSSQHISNGNGNGSYAMNGNGKHALNGHTILHSRGRNTSAWLHLHRIHAGAPWSRAAMAPPAHRVLCSGARRVDGKPGSTAGQSRFESYLSERLAGRG